MPQSCQVRSAWSEVARIAISEPSRNHSAAGGGYLVVVRWVAAVLMVSALLAGCSEPPPEEAVAEHIELFGKYCTDCHNDAEAAGNMSLEHVTPASVAAKPGAPQEVLDVAQPNRGAVQQVVALP